MPKDLIALDEMRSTERAGAAYRAHFDLLWFLATRRFRVPTEDAREVIHDVFVAFIRNEGKIGTSSLDERSWLVGTTCNACRYYWRRHHEVELPLDIKERIDPITVAESAIARVVLAQVLRDIPARCREVLRLRYSEGETPDEIAVREAVRRGSAKNLISKCLFAARTAFLNLASRSR